MTNIDRLGRTHGQRPFKRCIGQIGDDDGCCSSMPRGCGDQGADRAGTRYQHGSAFEISRLRGRMEADREWFRAGGFAGRYQRSGRNALHRRDHQPVPKHALLVGQVHGAAHEAHVLAVDRQVLPAEPASAAWLAGIDGDQIANRKSGHAGTQGCDIAGGFVPRNDRFPDPDGTEAAVLVIMEVGAANAACRHLQQNLAIPGRSHFGKLQPKIAPAV